jgi:hypothetical protein
MRRRTDNIIVIKRKNEAEDRQYNDHKKGKTRRRTDNIMAIKRENEAKDRQYNGHKKEKRGEGQTI